MNAPAQWAELLEAAVSQPGRVLEAYTAFHGYSLGNQLLAHWQCHGRGIPPGPLATFQGWKAKGRHVRKGEKALTLCQPVVGKKKTDEEGRESRPVFFLYRPSWFTLCQTDGPDVSFPPLPSWEKDRALTALDVTLAPFELSDGNTQGYASGRTVHVSPLAQLPVKTLLHELAHVVLGHTDSTVADGATLPRSLREAEAECTAMLCLESLSLPGAEYCRGYVQSWYGAGNPIPEANARRIFSAADRILAAGRPALKEEAEHEAR